MKFRAAIFDLDGTLLNSLSDIADSMNHVLDVNGFPVHPTNDFRYFVGEGMRVLVQRALPASLSDQNIIDSCTAQMKEEYAKRWKCKTSIYDGVPELLQKMTINGLSIAVLSNKPHNFTVEMIHHFFGKFTFEEILGAGQFPNKPDPSGALHIAKKFGFSPSGFLYVGDSAVDMKTAKSAGMFACGCLWGFRGKEELISGGADILVESPSRLWEVVTDM